MSLYTTRQQRTPPKRHGGDPDTHASKPSCRRVCQYCVWGRMPHIRGPFVAFCGLLWPFGPHHGSQVAMSSQKSTFWLQCAGQPTNPTITEFPWKESVSGVTAASQRHHGGITAASRRHHSRVTAASCRRHSSITSASQRRHSRVTSASCRRHSSITAASRRRHNGVMSRIAVGPPPRRALCKDPARGAVQQTRRTRCNSAT